MKIFNCRRCQQPTDRILRRASDGTSPRLAGVRAVSCMIFHFSIPNTDSNIQEFGEEKNSGLWNVVVEYIAVFLSIFLLESIWIWTKTNRCFRCQGAWLWVTYSPGKKYSVCLCPNMHIHICWELPRLELENVGGWYLRKTAQIKRGGKRTLAEHLQRAVTVSHGNHLPWSSHQVFRVSRNLTLHQAQRLPDPSCCLRRHTQLYLFFLGVVLCIVEIFHCECPCTATENWISYGTVRIP